MGAGPGTPRGGGCTLAAGEGAWTTPGEGGAASVAGSARASESSGRDPNCRCSSAAGEVSHSSWTASWSAGRSRSRSHPQTQNSRCGK